MFILTLRKTKVLRIVGNFRHVRPLKPCQIVQIQSSSQCSFLSACFPLRFAPSPLVWSLDKSDPHPITRTGPRSPASHVKMHSGKANILRLVVSLIAYSFISHSLPPLTLSIIHMDRKSSAILQTLLPIFLIG